MVCIGDKIMAIAGIVLLSVSTALSVIAIVKAVKAKKAADAAKQTDKK